MQDEPRIIQGLGFGASYIREFTVIQMQSLESRKGWVYMSVDWGQVIISFQRDISRQVR